MYRPTSHPTALADIVEGYLRSSPYQAKLLQARAAVTWRNMMPPAVGKHTSAIWLKKDTLYIQLTSAVLRQEMQANQAVVLRQLQAQEAMQAIRTIVFV